MLRIKKLFPLSFTNKLFCLVAIHIPKSAADSFCLEMCLAHPMKKSYFESIHVGDDQKQRQKGNLSWLFPMPDTSLIYSMQGELCLNLRLGPLTLKGCEEKIKQFTCITIIQLYCFSLSECRARVKLQARNAHDIPMSQGLQKASPTGQNVLLHLTCIIRREAKIKSGVKVLSTSCQNG